MTRKAPSGRSWLLVLEPILVESIFSLCATLRPMVGEQAGPMFSCNLARGTRAFILVVLSACLLASCRADDDELSSIAVLPLENASSDPSDSDYLADGIRVSCHLVRCVRRSR